MGLVERFSKLRSRWSRNFPPNLARLMLLGCAALWGGSYLLAKFAMEAIPPQWLMGLRMIGACLCMLALFHKHIVPYLTPKIIVPALVVGLTYWGTMVTQTIGLQTIEPGRSAFLTAAYCVLTPFATWIISKNRPKAINLVAGRFAVAECRRLADHRHRGHLLVQSDLPWCLHQTLRPYRRHFCAVRRCRRIVHHRRVVHRTHAERQLAGTLSSGQRALSVPRRHDECPDHAEHRSGSRACLAGVNHHVYGKSVRCHVLRAVLGRDNHVVIKPTKQSLHRN